MTTGSVSALDNDLTSDAVIGISEGLTVLLADVFALYLKTKNFHWHMCGSHFREYHLLLDDHAEQLFDITDEIAERARKIGGRTIRSIGEIARKQRIADNDTDGVPPLAMLRELLDDNKALAANMLALHGMCDEARDVATASLLENWIDQSQNRSWFLYETTRSYVGGCKSGAAEKA